MREYIVTFFVSCIKYQNVLVHYHLHNMIIQLWNLQIGAYEYSMYNRQVQTQIRAPLNGAQKRWLWVFCYMNLSFRFLGHHIVLMIKLMHNDK